MQCIRADAPRPLVLSDWRQRNRTFFGALEVERNVMFLILSLIVVVATLNIVSGLILLAERPIKIGDLVRIGQDEGDGLGAYRAIAAGAPAHLTPGGWLAVEIGPSQASAVAGLMEAAGFRSLRVLPDLDGRDRVVTGRAG